MIGTKDIWVKERRSKIHHYVSGVISALEILAIAYIGHFGLATILAIATLLMAAGYSLQYKLMDAKERV